MAANRSNGATKATNKTAARGATRSNGKTSSGSARKARSAGSRTTVRPGHSRSSPAGNDPSPIVELSSRLRKRLRDLESEIERTEKRYRQMLDKYLKESGGPIGLDVERRWRELTDPTRRDIARLLRRLEEVVEPSRKLRRRRPAKAKTAKTARTARAA